MVYMVLDIGSSPVVEPNLGIGNDAINTFIP